MYRPRPGSFDFHREHGVHREDTRCLHPLPVQRNRFAFLRWVCLTRRSDGAVDDFIVLNRGTTPS